MEDATKPDNPFVKNRREFWNRLWQRFVNNITIIRIELLFTLAAIALSYFSLRSSNKALSITQEQFEIANRPFLQIEMEMDSVKYMNGWPIEFKYRIKNIGKYPVKILQANTNLQLALPFIDTTHGVKVFIGESEQGQIYVTDMSRIYSIELKNHVPKEAMEMFSVTPNKNKELGVYVFCDYLNLVNNKMFTYECNILIGDNRMRIVKNENRPALKD